MNTELTRTNPTQDTNVPAETEAAVTRRGPMLTPAVDIYRSEAGWLVRADLPGVAPDALTVDVDRGRLTIEAHRSDDSPIGGYRRTLQLPDVVDTEGIEAKLADGVLELTIPRDARTRTRRVEVRTA